MEHHDGFDKAAKVAAFGILGYGLFVVVRRYWWAILVLMAIAHLNYVYGGGKERDDLLASFPYEQVQLTGLRAEQDGSWISDISAEVKNGGPVAISNLQLDCKFATRPDISRDPQVQNSHVVSDTAYGSWAPGESRAIRVAVHGNAYLLEADPASFECHPVFDLDKAALFKAAGKSYLDLLSQIDTSLSEKMEGPLNGERWRMVVRGVITNPTAKTVNSLEVTCALDTGDISGPVNQTQTFDVEVKPGHSRRYELHMPLIDTLHDAPFGYHACHLSGAN